MFETFMQISVYWDCLYNSNIQHRGGVGVELI